jgi:hypothetical protein
MKIVKEKLEDIEDFPMEATKQEVDNAYWEDDEEIDEADEEGAKMVMTHMRADQIR